MRIPLTQQSPVNLPSIAVNTPRIDSSAGYAEMAAGVARFGEGVVKLFDKKQAADDLRFELDTDIDLDAKALEFEQWKNDPKNLNRPDNDFIPYWENHLETNLIPPLQKRINDSKVSAEAKYRAEQKINNWSANMRTGVYSDAFRRTGEAFKGSLDLMRSMAINSSDPSKMDKYTLYVRDGISRGIFTEEQGALMLEDAGNVRQTIGQGTFKLNLDTMLTAGQFENARKSVEDAKNNGFITPTEATNYNTNIEFKYEYNKKKEDAEIEIDKDPAGWLERQSSKPVDQSKGTIIAPPVNAPAELSPYIASFQKYGEEYGIDPNFLMAVSMFETGNGKSSAFKNKNNATGISGATGPKTMASVDESIRIAAKAISNYKANSVEGIGAIYSPPGASNDPNQTNAEWPSSVRAKYKELTGVELPKDYNPKKYSSTGEFSPNDQYILTERAKTNLARKASDQFQTFKQAVDIGQIIPTSIDTDTEGNKLDTPINNIDSILQSPQFKELNADPLMRESAKLIADIKANNLQMNDPAFYEKMTNDILNYNISKDSSGLIKAQLGAKIESLFNGPYEAELKERLKNISENKESQRSSSIISNATSSLNRLAFTNQGLGKFRTQKSTPSVPGEIKTLFGIDRLWKDTAPKPAAPIVTTPDIEVLIDGKVEKRKGVPTPVEIEDPESRANIATKVASIRQRLENDVKAGIITTREQADAKMREYYKAEGGTFTLSNESSPSNIPLQKPSVKSVLDKYKQ